MSLFEQLICNNNARLSHSTRCCFASGDELKRNRMQISFSDGGKDETETGKTWNMFIDLRKESEKKHRTGSRRNLDEDFLLRHKKIVTSENCFGDWGDEKKILSFPAQLKKRWKFIQVVMKTSGDMINSPRSAIWIVQAVQFVNKASINYRKKNISRFSLSVAPSKYYTDDSY
jgi:hypothetical protein